jgi:hypothetical protein
VSSVTNPCDKAKDDLNSDVTVISKNSCHLSERCWSPLQNKLFHLFNVSVISPTVTQTTFPFPSVEEDCAMSLKQFFLQHVHLIHIICVKTTHLSTEKRESLLICAQHFVLPQTQDNLDCMKIYPSVFALWVNPWHTQLCNTQCNKSELTSGEPGQPLVPHKLAL